MINGANDSHILQTAFQFRPQNRVIVLAEHNEDQTMINEENEAGLLIIGLPGIQPMPTIQFSLAGPNLPVLADLEVIFDI